MRAVFGLVLLIGLGLAGFAVYMVQQYFEEQQAQLATVTPTVTVLAVKETVEFGEPILSDNLQFIEYAEAHLPEGAFILTGETDEAGETIIATTTEVDFVPSGSRGPRFALRQIEANEPLLLVKLSEPGQETTVTNSLTAGMRAFEIQVDISTGASSFLRPGGYVDVYWSGRVTTNNLTGDSQELTRLILTRVRIVAVDQSTDPARVATSAPRSVTVEVSPQQVGALAQARSTGTITLALAGTQGSDEEELAAFQIDTNELLGIVVQQEEIVEEEEEAEQCFITVRNSTGIEQIPTPCAN